jgi:hypothetical protein
MIEFKLIIKYRFRSMPFLVADRFGEFYMLSHCPNHRTIPFKTLDKSKGYIYYHGNRISLVKLRCRVIK